MNCDICKIINDDNELVVVRTTKWVATLNPDQQNLGKCWVTLIDHKSKLSELDNTDWNEFIEIIKILEQNTSKACNPSRYNWQCLMNDLVSDDNQPHIHWHFAPRYKNPVNFNNETFIDENYPKTNKKPRKTNESTLLLIANELKK
jgi:diadenosine tetraphosphate (Ap4A) HIT family hydrolase